MWWLYNREASYLVDLELPYKRGLAISEYPEISRFLNSLGSIPLVASLLEILCERLSFLRSPFFLRCRKTMRKTQHIDLYTVRTAFAGIRHCFNSCISSCLKKNSSSECYSKLCQVGTVSGNMFSLCVIAVWMFCARITILPTSILSRASSLVLNNAMECKALVLSSVCSLSTDNSEHWH